MRATISAGMSTTLRPLRPTTVAWRCLARLWSIRAHFSQSSRLLDTQSSETGSKEDSSGEQQQRPKGSYTRVLATFAVGIPLGWAARTYLGDGQSTNTATPADFVRYALARKEDVSSTCSIFTLKPASTASIDTQALYNRRALSSVQFKQPQLQIARSYTVLPPVQGQDPQELRFLIRKERNGEVSGYLHRLALGSEVELRGPSIDHVLPKHVQQVVFMAGGTGIAPAMQLADKLSGETDVHILWATRRREDCEGGVSDTRTTKASSGWDFFGWWSPFRLPTPDASKTVSGVKQEPNAIISQIDGLKEQHAKTTIDYYVDDENSFIGPADITALTRTTSVASGDETGPTRRLLFVSGPEGFVTHWAGRKQWAGGREIQGPLGGVLSTLDIRGWDVVKL